jgi:succinate dehydrogenase (ubiquinone) flavoprotein subunit
MGGIPTNWKGQVINTINDKDEIIEGLWAAGEAACSSVHGANRLGANSLLDIVIFGKSCAENIALTNNPNDNIDDYDEIETNNDIEKYNYYLTKEGDLTVSEIRLEMQKIMQKHAGVFRNDKLLESGVKKMNEIYKLLDRVHIDDKSKLYNTEFIELLELKNLIENALVTIHSANFRKESRGSHSHEDYPERDDKNWMKHTISRIKDGIVSLDKRSVITLPLNDEIHSIPPAKRVY